MKKSDLWENITLLVSAVLLLPIWVFTSNQSQLSARMFTLSQMLQAVLVIILVAILVRRIRRTMVAFRANKNRQNPFPF
jgi:nitrogen fixation/metabolism regulation signal transduction histidine kinase